MRRDRARASITRPRGVSKEGARLDEWLKDAAPPHELRRQFHGDPSRWSEFRNRYPAELEVQREQLRPLAQRARVGRGTLVFAGKDERRNNAVVLREYLQRLGGG